jgi:hypothetical protein
MPNGAGETVNLLMVDNNNVSPSRAIRFNDTFMVFA